MAATELLCQVIGIDPNKFSKEENLILEIDLFARICEELVQVMNVDSIEEDTTMEAQLARNVINDIVTSGDYTLQGIARYTQMPEEVIYEVAAGLNISPSAAILRRIVELHRAVRPDLYRQIIRKVTMESMLLG